MKRLLSAFISLLTISSSTLMAAEMITTALEVNSSSQPSLILTSKTLPLTTSAAQSYDYSLVALQQAYYRGIDGIDSTIRLQQGLWAGEPYQPGGNVMPQVMLLGDLKATGQLNTYSAPMAVVLLNYSPGGSGQFLYLAVMAYQHGKLVNIATQYVGDRVRVKDLTIKNHNIILDVIQAGKQDPTCCPGDVARHIWHLNHNKLIEVPSHQATVRLTPAILANTDWRLESWRYGDPVTDDSKISLRYINGHFVGMVDCNNYTVTVKTLLRPGFIDVLEQHAAITNRQCDNPLSIHRQKRYFEQLANVTQFTYFAGKLALTYRHDNYIGVMIFDAEKVQS
ncbi:META domain-containing protein [uncultured Photobacterium sp.]|uniref:META domain-containing protein n=1 Tax=uncultured Photobacterium sp. TaxID=173973 RepID=UPI002628FE77|nr:META domain-containing protein [uncultured Photobacterium sp.]